VKENADGITEVEKSSYGIYVSTGTRVIGVDSFKNPGFHFKKHI
jgi:hypothetical protein